MPIRKKKDPKVGTGKKPKGSSRRLYTDENPKDTVSIKYATPADARKTGILANAAMILTQNALSIRQAIVDDPELSPEPKLTIIVEKKIPGKLIPELLKISGVEKVSIY